MAFAKNTARTSLLHYAAIVLATMGVAALVFGSRMAATNEAGYDTNEFGVTYGSAADAPSLEAEPGLIQAVAMNGKDGYIKSRELHAAAPQARNPEEAVAMMAEREATQKAAFYDALSAQAAPAATPSAPSKAEADRLYDEIVGDALDIAEATAVIAAADSPFDEAVLLCAYEAALESTRRYIPVYAIDGTTVIGDFPVG